MNEIKPDDWLAKRQKRQKWRDDLAMSVFPLAHHRAHEIAVGVSALAGGVCAVEWGISRRAELDGLICIAWSDELADRCRFEQRIDAFFLESTVIEPALFAVRLVEYIRAAQA